VAMLAPFGPHLAQELWQVLGHEGYILDHPWPSYDPGVLERDTISLAVQVDGKVRGSIEVPADLEDKDALVGEAMNEANVARHLEGRTIARSVVVPGKIISLITS
jgi:leucyl-tRNA synthetase